MLKTVALSKNVALSLMLASTAFLAAEAGAKPKTPTPEPTPPVCSSVNGVACLKAPEIDASSAVAGLTFLAGGVAIVLGRRTKRLQTKAN